MSEAYDKELIELAETNLKIKLKFKKGLMFAVAGPNLETKAEYRFLRSIKQMLKVNCSRKYCCKPNANQHQLSIIIDECFPDALKPVDLQEILAAAAEANPKMTKLMKEVVSKL